MDNEYRYTNRAGTPAVAGEQAAQVLRNTYGLLAMSLAVSAAAGWFAMANNVGFINPFVVIGVYFALLFVNAKLENSAWGILSVFGITGWLGFTTGPIIAFYANLPGGMAVVNTALSMTAVVFMSMSAIALVTRKDFSFMGSFLMVGLIIAFVCAIVTLFVDMPVLRLAVSAMFALLSSLLILWQTSAIIHGGETNYIRATVVLFVSIYNLFLSLLHLLTALSGDD
ncbi:Bax inhibitor-1/YccA family protein [Alcanivorax sp. JB21]|uniref:Bax inhibitor-1/YccA family protein n=1 Tax=Alcanivorax limicola TaxID=2874102 RepID=UPI001CC1AE22|nr:Bax inhibitor-1/YccA family protein [Alcanivorax limicola]MBZ2187831.1 Bax inhibitor-1/YccA family protein [Alcanivorax limicola]